jgi:hypothetical protein
MPYGSRFSDAFTVETIVAVITATIARTLTTYGPRELTQHRPGTTVEQISVGKQQKLTKG